jgi:hypothetical protein
VVAILTPIYEAEFLGFSYGFRPQRNQHLSLAAHCRLRTKRFHEPRLLPVAALLTKLQQIGEGMTT